MIATDVGRLLFTVVFIALAVQSGWSLLGSTDRTAAVHHVGGGVMALGMAAMAWPQWLRWPTGPQALLYVGLAAASVIAVRAERRARFRLGATVMMHRAHHIVMLGAMAWMVLAMGGTSDQATAAGGGHDHSGMDLGVSTSVSGVVLTAAMIAMTLLIVVRYALSTDDEKECGTGPTTSCALMGAGMVAMSWTMVAG